MMRKGLIIVVCLMLTLFGFSAALAEETETVTTITCKPGALLADYDVLNQICEIAAIRIHSLPDGYGALVLSLNDTDVLNNLFRADEDGLYVQSDLLGTEAHYFSWEDLAALADEQIQNNPEFESIRTMFGGDTYHALIGGSMSDEEMEAQAMEYMGIDDATADFISSVEEAVTVETGTFTFQGSDVANQKTVSVLTKDDLIAAVDLPMVREQMIAQEQLASPDLSEEEVGEEVDEILTEMKDAIEEANLTVTSTSYTMDDAFAAMEIVLSGEMDDEAFGATMTITKTSIGQAAFYQLNACIYEGEEESLNQTGELYVSDTFVSGKYTMSSIDNEPILAAAFNCDLSQTGIASGEITATLYEEAFGEQIAFIVMFEQTTDGNATDTSLELYTGSDAGGIKASLGESSVISLYLQTVTQPDSGFFSTLQSATPESSIQLTQMSDEELDAYSLNLEQTVIEVIYTIVENLPADISNSLMEGLY